jgi:transposase-like protein
MKHGVNANQLRRWMRLAHLRSAAPLPALLPVTVQALGQRAATADKLPANVRRSLPCPMARSDGSLAPAATAATSLDP